MCEQIPEGEWFCSDCRPKETRRSERRKRPLADDEEREEVYGKRSGDKEEDSEDDSDQDEEEESESESEDDEEQSKKLILTLFSYARFRSLAIHINQEKTWPPNFEGKMGVILNLEPENVFFNGLKA